MMYSNQPMRLMYIWVKYKTEQKIESDPATITPRISTPRKYLAIETVKIQQGNTLA
jgi:hypothetical protein